MIIKIFLLYLLLINIIAFVIMGLDKYKAKHNKWRISEKNLFFSALLFGSFGAILGMKLFRHKTKHRLFIFGMPLIFILQIAIVIYLKVVLFKN